MPQIYQKFCSGGPKISANWNKLSGGLNISIYLDWGTKNGGSTFCVTEQRIWLPYNIHFWIVETLIVTGFGKTCIVHTANFAHLKIYEIWQKQHRLKFAEMIEKQQLYKPCKFQVYPLFITDFMVLQNSMCELYTFLEIRNAGAYNLY